MADTQNDPERVAATYGRLATRYADAFLDELARKPLDRALLDMLCDELRPRGGRVADFGTGSGHVARYLHDRGLDAVGIDLSPGMVKEARARHPGVAFAVGDLSRLDAPDASFAGATAFYAIVHLTRAELVRAFVELRRVLAHGAPLLLAFHAGDESIQPPEFLGETVDIAWNLFPPAVVHQALEEAGLSLEAELVRRPYPGEHPSQRAYVLARRES